MITILRLMLAACLIITCWLISVHQPFPKIDFIIYTATKATPVELGANGLVIVVCVILAVIITKSTLLGYLNYQIQKDEWIKHFS